MKWTGEFWDGLYSLLGIKKRMSTSFHPQTDGQMERVNQTLETYLRTFINYHEYDWDSLLPLVEFAYNNSVTQAIELTPFYTNYGYHPKTIWTSSEKSKNPTSKAYVYWIKATHDRAM
jgi:transposase InsO family protein